MIVIRVLQLRPQFYDLLPPALPLFLQLLDRPLICSDCLFQLGLPPLSDPFLLYEGVPCLKALVPTLSPPAFLPQPVLTNLLLREVREVLGSRAPVSELSGEFSFEVGFVSEG